MIHCVSVGELLSVRRLIEVLRGSDSGIEIVVTTTTDTGTARARALFADVPGVAALRYPLDLSWSVGRFLDAVRPTLILLVELETWPNFLRAAQRRKIPAAIINGRLTERSFKRYKLIRPIMRGMLRRLTWMGIQTETIAARFAALGAEREKISVIPTLKYDAAVSGPVAGTEAIARALGLDGAAPLLVAGSTGPGEERIVVEAFGMVRQRFAEVRLAIAPRKPEAVPLALEAIAAGQLTAIQRTQFPDDVAHPPAAAAEHVIVLDTLGELRKLYALATGVFVGRSLVPLGGSDMIEVAALGKPLCVGPHTANFAEVVEVLRAADAVREVTDARTLAATWAAWLANRAEAQAFGERGREAIEVQRGSTERYQQWISALAGS